MNQDQLQELNRILQLWAESRATSTDPLFVNDGCPHEVRHYQGFTEEYEYCIKCDSKKLNGQWIPNNHIQYFNP